MRSFLQMLFDRLSLLSGHLGEERSIERAPDDRRRVQQVDDLGREPGETLAQRVHNARGKCGVDRGDQVEGASPACNDAGFEPPPQQLLGEERIALALRREQRSRRRVERRTKNASSERSHLGDCQRAECDGGEPPQACEFGQRTLKRWAMCHLTFAVGTKHEQSCLRLVACHMAQQVERGRVGPLQIVKHEQ